MIPPSEPPIGPESSEANPGRARGPRKEITPADLTMYSAITGRAPSSEERERALTWAESDPVGKDVAGAADSTSMRIVPGSYPLRPWHPSAISLRVRELWFNGLTLKTARPQISHWLRRFSVAIQEGRRRVVKGNRAA